MANTFTNINLHLIFHTKSTGCTIKEEHLSRVFHYIGGVVHAMAGFVYTVGGRPDHIHILTSLPVTKSVSDFVCSIKANTSRWIKDIDPAYAGFSWQAGYGAFSVSKSNIGAVTTYIANQKEHHRKYSAQEEFNHFLERHGVQRIETDMPGDV